MNKWDDGTIFKNEIMENALLDDITQIDIKSREYPIGDPDRQSLLFQFLEACPKSGDSGGFCLYCFSSGAVL